MKYIYIEGHNYIHQLFKVIDNDVLINTVHLHKQFLFGPASLIISCSVSIVLKNKYIYICHGSF